MLSLQQSLSGVTPLKSAEFNGVQPKHWSVKKKGILAFFRELWALFHFFAGLISREPYWTGRSLLKNKVSVFISKLVNVMLGIRSTSLQPATCTAILSFSPSSSERCRRRGSQCALSLDNNLHDFSIGPLGDLQDGDTAHPGFLCPKCPPSSVVHESSLFYRGPLFTRKNLPSPCGFHAN